MQRKEVNALYEDDLREFLVKNNLLEDFDNGLIKCHFCETTITKENISAIFYKNGFCFSCNDLSCISTMNEEK